jgi:geranylgeranyl diphosphate synthase type II
MHNFAYNMRMYDDLHGRTAKAVTKYLEDVFLQRVTEAADIDPAYRQLWEHIASQTAGGKRIRPYLTMIGYGEFDDSVVPIAAAQELLHVAMLMHDDVIDEDMLRRGRKNINGLYLDRYLPRTSERLAVHYAYSAGLLAGDALLSEAYHCIYDTSLADGVKVALGQLLHRSVYDVIGGELLDVEAGILKNITIDPIKIARYKTASYSFVGPLLMGAKCAGADDKTTSVLREFGEAAGLAFQLQDDLLGIFGDEHTVGKSVLLDLREAKETCLVAEHRRRMDEAQTERFAQAFGNERATTAELEALRDDMATSGAKAQTEAWVQKYYESAHDALAGLDDTRRTHQLTRLIDAMRGREL